ncbi:hypothetical protein KNE206_65210 [Kitasatospora sp. NE20-6]|uniref:outer membrane protein assembly factor BamB family protein n=1 Tax=Kitasatospora sp. NE20-6 TaxID=2859066 RepID=UPI0034DC449A
MSEWSDGPAGGTALDPSPGDAWPASTPAAGEELHEPPAAPGRRRVLLGAAAALIGGAAAWRLTRDGRPPREPRLFSGPAPVWTVDGPGPQTPERLAGTLPGAAYVTAAALLLLDPATGSVRHTVRLPEAGRPAPGPTGGTPGPGRLLPGDERVYTATATAVRGYRLTDGVGDREATATGLLGRSAAFVLDGWADGTAYGRAASGSSAGSLVFGLGTGPGTTGWVRPAGEGGGQLLDLQPAPGGLLLARSSRDELVALDAADGSRRWLVAADQALRRMETDAARVYVAQRGSGLRAVRLSDGGEAWSLPPARDAWRRLRPLAADGLLFVPRDDGVVTRHAAGDGSEVWSCRLPFRPDARCRPVLAGGTLFVPGPRTGGIAAVDAATGELRWTFQDYAPGAGYWQLGTDGRQVYAGHDSVLHALRA